MKDGFIRIAAATPDIQPADCMNNANNIIKEIEEAFGGGANLVVFPELCITGYTCEDLFLQKKLLDSSDEALMYICEKTKNLDIISVVGLPVRGGACLYNCGAVIYHGEILGMVPKMNIPNYSEFYEQRHFKKGGEGNIDAFIGGKRITICSNTIFQCNDYPEFRFAVEICEDLWVPVSPSCYLAQCGANIILNLSASDDVIGKAEYRRDLVKMNSAKLICAYAYADAGFGESTTDMVFSGQNMIAENGIILSESKRFENGVTFADVDLQKIEGERRKTTTYPEYQVGCNCIGFNMPLSTIKLNRNFPKTPFVPQSGAELDKRCNEILSLQSMGLATRLKHTGLKGVVLGLSGGLDSTLALIVAVRSFKILNLPSENIICVTMPCFGTTDRTKSNAVKLAEAYGVTLKEINIGDSVKQHLKDIEHDGITTDVTYENAQARERTQVLMDIANQNGYIVVGTGDLSELALGWATYNGDHMSMYAVNSSIPKTLVRYLTAFEASKSTGELKRVLNDILDTPVSPELIPPKNGEISQKTEELVGPYELHDFFLYYFMRFGFTPSKIFRLAKIAFKEEYSDETIKKWLKVFVTRFFRQQFKRSCLPDGPKVGSVTLSPRGDWRMPSDASVKEWLKDFD